MRPQGDMAVAALPRAGFGTRPVLHSVPVPLSQFVGSKSLLRCSGTDAMPGIAFPRPFGCIVGPFGPRFPTRSSRSCPLLRGTVRCYDCLHPSRSVPLVAPFRYPGWCSVVRVPPGLRRGRFAEWQHRPPDARVFFMPVTRYPAIVPKETGGSPEFPDYPVEHMPRSQTPVVSRLLALAQPGQLPSTGLMVSAFGPLARPYPLTTIIHFSGLNTAACVLALPLLRTPSLEDRTSVRLPTWWLAFGRVGLESASHPLGNLDMFQEVSPLFSRPEFSSARQSFS